jgi:predicted Zn-dependent protease
MKSENDLSAIIAEFQHVAPSVDYWSLRIVEDNYESLNIRQNIVQPPYRSQNFGAHITLVKNGSFAYAATSLLTREGFKQAIEHALRWAENTAQHTVVPASLIPHPLQSGRYESTIQLPWESTSVSDKLNLLQDINRELKIHDSIVDWQAQLARRNAQVIFVTSDDIEVHQSFHYLIPGYKAVANEGIITQSRSGGGWGSARQGGLEQLAAFDFPQSTQQVAEEAIELVNAPDCPSGTMSILLMPNQMMLQIHESIGHPLEMDRILGDERNYAGTSFVTVEMCGSYQYGSDLLNVSYDPHVPQEQASYAFDDEGTPAEYTYIIQNGILKRLLGGAVSQARAQLIGVANARASAWNRPPIDRMANLNLEPGTMSMDDLVASIEYGVLMDNNLSWSIDDSRNKFQFGCELGKIIKDGEINGILKNPNYRGISATFWRNLTAVGDSSTFEIWGTPNCGKGEPNQVIQVGHASPACMFHEVEVFGGE